MSLAAEDPGFEALRQWLRATGVGPADGRIRRLVGDVSRRRYLRLEDPDSRSSLVLAIYPEDMSDAYQRFEATTALLQEAAIPVPRIHARDDGLRFMALDDAGARSLYGEPVGARETERLYRQVVEMLPRLQTIDRSAVERINPPLDRTLLQRELDQTWELFFGPALSDRPSLQRRLQQSLDRVLHVLESAAPIVCHRDLMARNLQIADGVVVVLDHQDLRMGPPGYDLASLLHDSLRLSPRQRRLLEQGATRQVAGSQRQPDDLGSETGPDGGAAACYWPCVVQRTAKIVGTFCSFALRGGRRHLPLIPAAIESLCEGLREANIDTCAERDLAPVLLDYWSANLDDFGGARLP